MVLTGSYWYEEPIDGLYNNSTNTIKVYPNPVSDVLTIDNSIGVTSVMVTNSIGQLVKQVYNKNSLKVNDLIAGVYLISITDENGTTYYQRIVKK